METQFEVTYIKPLAGLSWIAQQPNPDILTMLVKIKLGHLEWETTFELDVKKDKVKNGWNVL